MPARRFDAAALALALAASVAIVGGAPYIGQIRGALQSALPGQYRTIVAGVVAAALTLAVAGAVMRIRDRRALRYGALAAAVVVGVIYATVTRSGNPEQDLVERFHFVEYGLLTYFFYRVAARASDASALVLSFCAAVLVGIADEAVQWFVPGRVGELRDLFINAAAAACGVLFCVGARPPRTFAIPEAPRARRRMALALSVVALAGTMFVDAVHLGHEVGSPVRRFRSQWTADELRAAAQERTAGNARQPAGTFVREDHYLSEGRWHVQHRNLAWTAEDPWTAWHEQLILEEFYVPALHDDGAWPAEQRANTEAAVGGDRRPYVSDAAPYPIFIVPRWQLWLLAAVLVVAIWGAFTMRAARPAVQART